MVRSLLALALVLSFFACSDGITTPDRPPNIEGVIVERDRQTAISVDFPTIWVKAFPDEESCSVEGGGMVLTLLPDTRMWTRGADDKVREIEVEALVVGARVRVWASSAILESCPEQAEAGSVELMP